MTKIFPHRHCERNMEGSKICNLSLSIILVSFTTLHWSLKEPMILRNDEERERVMKNRWKTLEWLSWEESSWAGCAYSSRSSIETIPRTWRHPNQVKREKRGRKREGGRGRGGRKHSTFLQLTRLVWNWTPPWGANKCLVGACAAGEGEGVTGVKRLEGRKRCRWELLIVVD